MPNHSEWRLTCVYGEAQISERYKTWDLLKSLASANALPWLCIGDLNEVLNPHEHMGTGQRRHTQIQAFREVVDVCAFTDLGYNGKPWTFENKTAGGGYCRVRLDRALSNTDWLAAFP